FAKIIACLLIIRPVFSQNSAYDTPTDERILSFESEITVDTTGMLTVVEKITVRAAGNEINRGIYRHLHETDPLTAKPFMFEIAFNRFAKMRYRSLITLPSRATVVSSISETRTSIWIRGFIRMKSLTRLKSKLASSVTLTNSIG